MIVQLLPEVPLSIGRFDSLRLVHVQAQGETDLRIATDSETLRGGGGLIVKPTAGILSLWWCGPLWVIGASGATADFEVMVCPKMAN